jgi:hypothetical protein
VFGRPPIPRRALLAATLGAVYGTLILFSAGDDTTVILVATAWFLLSISLLFTTPLAYHAFTTWAILWLVWKVVLYARGGTGRTLVELALDDLSFPVACLALLMTSRYLAVAHEG